MKATNLMIGDWVTSIKKPFHLIRISDAFCYGKTASGSIVGPFFFEEIKPVSLISKILEKNGFIYTKPQLTTESEDMVWQYQNDEKQILIEIEEQMDDNLLDFYIGKFIGGINSCEIYFKHVHELQHALKLCGIEKEIIL